MKKAVSLFWNMILLTATMLFIRTAGVFFSAYLAKQIGSSGIGGYQLILSVYSLAVTLAISGIRFTATRLISEEFGKQSAQGVRKAVHCCLCYALCFGCLAAVLLFAGANLIGTRWLQDQQSIPALRLLALSLPFLAVSAVIGGYLTAVRKPHKGALIQIADQFVMISVTILCLNILLPNNTKFAYLSLSLGTLVSEFITCIFLFLSYCYDLRKHKISSFRSNSKTVKRMLSISLPIALSAYARSGLSTIQNLFIPQGLKKSGLSHEGALAAYGTIHGMVLPVVLYPAALLNVLAELLIPELTECQVKNHKQQIHYIITRVLKLSLLFALLMTAILFCFSTPLGMSIYQNQEVAFYLKIFAPLVIVMYMDTIVDGMLKGLGEQLSSMKYNIIDSFTSVLMVWFLLPVWGIKGYIFIVMASEILNFSLSLGRLVKITKLQCNLLNDLIKPILCIILSIGSVSVLFSENSFWNRYLPSSLFQGLILIGIDFLLLYTTSCLKKDDFIWFLRIVFPLRKKTSQKKINSVLK